MAARLLRDAGFRVKVFEASDQIGGVWVYSDSPARSLYKSLRTNLPKEVMAYSDFPFDAALPSFMKHEDVLNYLQAYARYFNLYPMIALSTPVRSAEYVPGTDWQGDGDVDGGRPPGR